LSESHDSPKAQILNVHAKIMGYPMPLCLSNSSTYLSVFHTD